MTLISIIYTSLEGKISIFYITENEKRVVFSQGLYFFGRKKKTKIETLCTSIKFYLYVSLNLHLNKNIVFMKKLKK